MLKDYYITLGLETNHLPCSLRDHEVYSPSFTERSNCYQTALSFLKFLLTVALGDNFVVEIEGSQNALQSHCLGCLLTVFL